MLRSLRGSLQLPTPVTSIIVVLMTTIIGIITVIIVAIH